jgi:hypothetical protein
MKRLALLLLFLPITASAWTRASDERIARKGAALAPPDLRLMLEKFQPEYMTGLQRAEADEGSESHHYYVLSRSGRLRERIQRETFTTVAMIRKGDSMAAVAEHLGILAHFVADANNPFHTANDDQRMPLVHDDFEQYFERRLSRFPTVFYGVDPQLTLDAFLDRMIARSARFYPLMVEEYYAGGERQSSSTFDDRSTAFGVASVSYSHAVTDLSNLFFLIWRQAGGDVRMAAGLRSMRVIEH